MKANMATKPTIFRSADRIDLMAFAGCNAREPLFAELDPTTTLVLDESEFGDPVLVIVHDNGDDTVLECHRDVADRDEAEVVGRSLIGDVVHEGRELKAAALEKGFRVLGDADPSLCPR